MGGLAPAPTIFVSALVEAAAGLAFLYAGFAFWRSRAPGARGVAAGAFALWWTLAGAYDLLSSVLDALSGLGALTLGTVVAMHTGQVALGSLSLAALVYYLLYLFTGRRRWVIPIVALYVLTGIAGLLYDARRQPVAILDTDWRTDVVYAVPPDAMRPTFAAILLLPPILGGLAYAGLSRRARDAAARRRMVLLGIALAGWFTAALVAEIVSIPFWQFATRGGIGLIAAGLVLRAYSTMALQGAGAGDAEPVWAARAMESEDRAQRLEYRVRQLI